VKKELEAVMEALERFIVKAEAMIAFAQYAEKALAPAVAR
jgi:hypothetical protein